MKSTTEPMPASEHAPNCPEPFIEWQADIHPGLARRGRCVNCEAIEVDRTNQTRITGSTCIPTKGIA